MNILVINGHDYTRWVEDDGYDWSRDDLDSEKTVRVKTGNMRRDKIAEKRNLTYKMLPMPEQLAAQLDTDLHAAQFTVQYHDLHGEQDDHAHEAPAERHPGQRILRPVRRDCGGNP